MKFIVFTLFLLSSLNAASSTSKATIVDYTCLEIDPFIVGDVCLLNLEKMNGKKLSIVLDYVDALMNEALVEGQMSGLQVSIEKAGLTLIRNAAAVDELKRYDDSYFYMYGDDSAVTLLNQYDSKKEMKTLANSLSYFSPSLLPNGYKAKKLRNSKLNQRIIGWLKLKTKEVKKDWKNYVYNSDEFYNNSEDDINNIANSPEDYLEVKYLLEISKSYKITKNGIHIGYVYEVTNWVESAIIQDGAWFDIYTTTELQVVHTEEETN